MIIPQALLFTKLITKPLAKPLTDRRLFDVGGKKFWVKRGSHDFILIFIFHKYYDFLRGVFLSTNPDNITRNI